MFSIDTGKDAWSFLWETGGVRLVLVKLRKGYYGWSLKSRNVSVSVKFLLSFLSNEEWRLSIEHDLGRFSLSRVFLCLFVFFSFLLVEATTFRRKFLFTQLKKGRRNHGWRHSSLHKGSHLVATIWFGIMWMMHSPIGRIHLEWHWIFYLEEKKERLESGSIVFILDHLEEGKHQCFRRHRKCGK